MDRASLGRGGIRLVGEAIVPGRHSLSGQRVGQVARACDHHPGRSAHIAAGRADDHRHPSKPAGAVGIGNINRPPPIGKWAGEAAQAGAHHHGELEIAQHRLRGQDAQFGQRGRRGARNSVRPGEAGALSLRLHHGGAADGIAVPARCNHRTSKPALRQGRGDEIMDRHAARALAHDGDVVRIAAEGRDVAAAHSIAAIWSMKP